MTENDAIEARSKLTILYLKLIVHKIYLTSEDSSKLTILYLKPFSEV